MTLYTGSAKETLPSYSSKEIDNLDYFYTRYRNTVVSGKPNLRIAKQLKMLIDVIQINEFVENSKTLVHSANDPAVKKYVLPVGIQKMDSFLVKTINWIKNKLLKNGN